MSTLTLVPSNTAKASTGFVQTFFDWDSPAQMPSVALDDVSELRSVIAAKSKQQSVESGAISTTHHRTAGGSKAKTSAKSSFSKNPPRRGQAEHVGVALVSVLGKYGISVDDLLIEIERQKKEGV